MIEGWTEARVEKLKVLWAAGMSCTLIAADLGGFDHCDHRGRSAVIGKIHRLKLPQPASKMSARGNRYPCGGIKPLTRSFEATPPPATSVGRIQNVTPLQAKKNGHDPAQRRNPSHNILAKIAIAEAEPGIPERLKGEAPDGTGIKLIDLDSSTCRWPRGMPGDPDFEFCGGYALKDMPYCAHHTRMAYVPTPARRPRTPAY